MKVYVYEFSDVCWNFKTMDTIVETMKSRKLSNKDLRFVFFGSFSTADLSVKIGYFNSLIGQCLCDFAISTKEQAVVFNRGHFNKPVTWSAKDSLEILKEHYKSFIEDYYKANDPEVLFMKNKDWGEI